MRIAILGATGRIGREVARVLGDGGHEVRPLNRAAGVDAYTGAGLAAALSDVEVVIDAVNAPTTDTAEITDFFSTVAGNVQRAASAAGVRRIIVVSIIGIDEFTGGHYAGKLAQERAYLAGPVPVRVLRAAQFHEFTEMMLEWTTRGDTADVPEFRAQLVAARTVAGHLADLALAATAPDRVDVAGPHEVRLAEAVAALARRRGAPAHVTEVTGATDPDLRRQADGALLPGPGAVLDGPTFQEWLDRTYPPSR